MANLTKTDCVELQGRLQSLNLSESYVALPTKLDFLRSRRFVDGNAAAHFAACDADNLVPQLVVDTSKALTPHIAANVKVLYVGALGADSAAMDDAMDIGADYDSSGWDEWRIMVDIFNEKGILGGCRFCKLGKYIELASLVKNNGSCYL